MIDAVAPGPKELGLKELGPDDLEDWDLHTVDVPSGDAYQSRAWAEFRGRHGWRPRFVRFEDGFRVLLLERPWSGVPGAGAYVSRGPIRAGEPAEQTAKRLVELARWLAASGVDVISSDVEMPVGTAYPDIVRRAGFRSVDEIQPSRHRMSLPIGEGATEDDLRRGLHTTTRQLIDGAERRGLRIVRYDALAGQDAGDGFGAPPADDPAAAAGAAFGRLYDLMALAATRLHFHLGPRAPFLDWASTGLAAGLIVLLEALSREGEPLGAAMFYRHGSRLTYSHSADRIDRRKSDPGVAHLQLWRAIQLAARESRVELDLAGVDVPGARRQPRPGEPNYGLYAFKRSFGGEWIELEGNHEWAARPLRYAIGRVTGALAGLAGRLRPLR